MKKTTRAVEARLLAGKGTRRRLPGGGRLKIDRPIPMLLVHRRRVGFSDQATEKLVVHASSVLVVGEDEDVGELVKMIARRSAEAFGRFLLLEVWAGPEPEEDQPPRFVVYGPVRPALIPIIELLQHELCGMKVADRVTDVLVRRGKPPAPPGLEPLLTMDEARAAGCVRFGLEIPPAYRDPASGDPRPLVLRHLRRDLTIAVRRFAHQFLLGWTNLRPDSYHFLGSRSIARAVWQVDEQLAAIADQFDFLLLCTPVNTTEAWQEFKAAKRSEAPRFQYRPMLFEPTVLKRALFAVPIEKVDDPALYQLFREKQDELDRQITLLLDMNTPRFVHGSIQLYGGVDDEEYRVACGMLERMPPEPRPSTAEKNEEEPAAPKLDATAIAALAEAEIETFRQQWPGIEARVHVREDIHTGMMVSHGSLLIGADTTISASRVGALLQHEVGTHVLTYWNGRAQPFRQLYSGLAGYEPLQEGLAVLAEALTGGLSQPRKRLLFGRVVAARLLIDGASFVDTYRALHDTWGFPARTAFTIALRIYRGGGLTKDAVYVRGVAGLLDYLRAGGEIEPLLLGKMALEHMPLVQELQAREILVPPPLRPRFLDAPTAAPALEMIRGGMTALQMLRDEK